MMETPWRVHLLGRLQVCRGEVTIDHFRTRKTSSLLGLLALRRGVPQLRSALARCFWPHEPLDTGRHNLSVALSALRKQLEPAGTPDGSVLLTSRLTVQLAVDAVTTDLDAFEGAVRGAAAISDRDRRCRQLREACGQYVGPFLSGHDDDWVLLERHRISRMFANAVNSYALAAEQPAEVLPALDAVQRALTQDPAAEELHQSAIRLYLAAGQSGMAVRQYWTLGRLLAADAGAEASQESLALVRHLLPAPEEPNVTTPASALERLGRTAGAARPSRSVSPGRLVQELSPESMRREGPLAPGDETYVTRVVDHAASAAVLRGESLLVISGPPQIGKTSLLMRTLDTAREAGARTAYFDLLAINEDQLGSSDSLFLAIAESLQGSLDLARGPREFWDPRRAACLNFRRYFREEVLPQAASRLVFGLDGMERLCTHRHGSDVLAMFHSWQNERGMERRGPWSRLTVLFVHSTEPHLFLPGWDPRFASDASLTPADFSLEEVRELNTRLGSPLEAGSECVRLHRLTGGHPYLVHRGLLALRAAGSRASSLDRLEAAAHLEHGIFGDHLRRMRLALTRDPQLGAALAALLKEHVRPSAEVLERMRRGGLLSDGKSGGFRLRSAVYGKYLRTCAA